LRLKVDHSILWILQLKVDHNNIGSDGDLAVKELLEKRFNPTEGLPASQIDELECDKFSSDETERAKDVQDTGQQA
jgi:hypothetical protein